MGGERAGWSGERSGLMRSTVDAPEQSRINYFNYFTEIEEHFIRRRGKYLLVSPLDWAALEGWKEMQIPLHVVLKGIDRVFDAHEKRPVRSKHINSILYCQQEVLTCFEEYRNAHLGERLPTDPTGEENATERGDMARGSPGGDSESAGQFSREHLREHAAARARELERLASRVSGQHTSLAEALERSRERLLQIEAELALGGALDLESLEMELTRLERLMLDSLKEGIDQEGVTAMRAEGERQLRGFRKRMQKEIFEQTLNTLVDKQLRERHGLPRLSLFYL